MTEHTHHHDDEDPACAVAHGAVAPVTATSGTREASERTLPAALDG